MLGDIKLANDSFSQAQRSDPNYVGSWIGQVNLTAFKFKLFNLQFILRHY